MVGTATMFSGLLILLTRVLPYILLGSSLTASFPLSTSRSFFYTPAAISSSVRLNTNHRLGTSSTSIPRRTHSVITVSMGASSSSTISNLSEPNKSTYHQKSILLTGASRGLGKSLAHALSTCHPSLLILSGRDEKALKVVQQECIQLASGRHRQHR